jgi:protoporphyrin/coproporphyrin ferrochelatase
MTTGLLILNLGTPDKPERRQVRKYLCEFLSDKRVINLPSILRYLLLYGAILPFRTPKSAKAYQAIWTDKGSPLLVYSVALKEKLQDRLGERAIVALGMRYGSPSVESALNELSECDQIIILPLYPQYASASTGSSIEKTLDLLGPKTIIPNIKLIRDFHTHPAYIQAQANLIQPFIPDSEFVLFSYHGLPENQLLVDSCKFLCKSGCSSESLLNSGCYRAQCQRTSEALAAALGLEPGQYANAFQSRLGRTKWIEPYTDAMLESLAAKGIKHLTIACPSFVADCLETLEEIGIGLNKRWSKLVGHDLKLVPCLNADDIWVDAILDITNLS